MKGDKGMHHAHMLEQTSIDLIAEFSGTLLGFDDFVSKWDRKYVMGRH